MRPENFLLRRTIARPRRRESRERRALLAALLLGLFGLLASTASLADGIEAAFTPSGPVHIEITKSERLLRVKRGDEVILQYPASWGRGGPGDKQQLGDKKTPTGIYRIMGFNNNSKFHLFMRLNYPNVKDAFYGLKSGVINRQEFDRIIEALRHGRLPPQNTALGGAIGLHGVGFENKKKLRIHSNLNWTEGCIALTNSEISTLRYYVSVGTEVVIKE